MKLLDLLRSRDAALSTLKLLRLRDAARIPLRRK